MHLLEVAVKNLGSKRELVAPVRVHHVGLFGEVEVSHLLPSLEDFTQKVNKKMYKGAISVILSELLRTDRLKVVSELDIAEPKTKNITSLMNSLKIKDALLMTDELDENLYLSSRNLYHVGVCDTQSIDPVSLIGYDNVVMSKAALKKVEAML